MTIRTWFLQGIDYAEAPQSLADLEARFQPLAVAKADLTPDQKWEPILRGERSTVRPGWVPLSELASTRRGIATGANGFFLLSESQIKEHDIRETSVIPCVGKANDVAGIVFSTSDLANLRARNAKCLLVNFRDELSASERMYVDSGEAEGLTSRYILANRSPWYSMEQRPIAPIWASVFGRGDLGFIYNAAGTSSLTNFHCVYPARTDTAFLKALTVTLNSGLVRAEARLHTRGYGGGLAKFEPNDLKSILVPDLRLSSADTLGALAELIDSMDLEARTGLATERLQDTLNAAVEKAGLEAAAVSGPRQLF